MLASDLIIKTKKGNVVKGYATNRTLRKKYTPRGIVIYSKGKGYGKPFNEKKNGFGHYCKNSDKLKFIFFQNK